MAILRLQVTYATVSQTATSGTPPISAVWLWYFRCILVLLVTFTSVTVRALAHGPTLLDCDESQPLHAQWYYRNLINMSTQDMSRLEMELELLEAMYPDQTQYSIKSREFKFTQDSSSLVLRLPESYPDAGLPDIISATDASKNDVRNQIKTVVKELNLVDGEEALDAIIAAYQQILETNTTRHNAQSDPTPSTLQASSASKTVIIWLHHLLNTNKRKLALSPTSLSGLTKPGYPGILVYSGPSSAVAEHVTTLKAQNWQAFNVRYEEEEPWTFIHGQGVREVETMAEVVKGVEAGKRATLQKEEFLKAVGIK